MLVFIYCWLTERTKYFFAVFFLFCSRTQKKNVAEPQKNLNLGPKIIIIFSFKIFFCQVFERTTNTSRAPLQLTIFCWLHALSLFHSPFLSLPTLPTAHRNLPWAHLLLSPCPGCVTTAGPTSLPCPGCTVPPRHLLFGSGKEQQNTGFSRYLPALWSKSEHGTHLDDQPDHRAGLELL